jgi:hypothetical protein
MLIWLNGPRAHRLDGDETFVFDETHHDDGVKTIFGQRGYFGRSD